MIAAPLRMPAVAERYVPAPALRAFVQQVFERFGYATADAAAAT